MRVVGSPVLIQTTVKPRVSRNHDQGKPVRFYRYRETAPAWARAALDRSARSGEFPETE